MMQTVDKEFDVEITTAKTDICKKCDQNLIKIGEWTNPFNDVCYKMHGLEILPKETVDVFACNECGSIFFFIRG